MPMAVDPAGNPLPGALRDREYHAYRGAASGQTAEAVVGPDSKPLARTTEEWLELLHYRLTQLVVGLSLLTDVDLDELVKDGGV